MTTGSSAPSDVHLVVLAAGLGTRYGSLKQLDPVGPGGTALLDFALADARRAGFRGGIVIVREEIAEAVEAHLARTVAGRFPIELVCQRLDDLPGGRELPAGRDRPWGTTHAVWAAREAVGDVGFVVANADDHYGLEAYSILHDHLVRAPAVSSPPEAPAAWALAAYRLGDVLSSHGAVNRGLCRVDPDGWLEDVVEGRELHRTMEGGIEGRTREHGTVLLGGDARVSTNLWAFAPGAAEILGEGLASFLDEQGDDPRAECTLPDVIRTGLRDRACRVFVYPVDGDYFGVTRVEDRPGVVDRLAKRGHPWEVV